MDETKDSAIFGSKTIERKISRNILMKDLHARAQCDTISVATIADRGWMAKVERMEMKSREAEKTS